MRSQKREPLEPLLKLGYKRRFPCLTFLKFASLPVYQQKLLIVIIFLDLSPDHHP